MQKITINGNIESIERVMELLRAGKISDSVDFSLLDLTLTIGYLSIAANNGDHSDKDKAQIK